MRRAITALLVGLLLASVATPAAAQADPASCVVSGGNLAWGVKKEFRDYIVGPVAAGSWIEGEGASYLAGQFHWNSASGDLTPSTGRGLVGFIGSVTFTGHAGAVTRTFDDPEVQFVRPAVAYLLLDVLGTKNDGTKLDSFGVQFAQLDLPTQALAVGARTMSFSDVPATLTEDGARVFGRYPAGSALDPVSLTLRFSAACSPAAGATVAPEKAGGTSGVGALPWLVLAFGVVAILALLALVLMRRRTP